jgi:hypothetical protein
VLDVRPRTLVATLGVAFVAVASAVAGPIPGSFTLLILEERDQAGGLATTTLADTGYGTYVDANGVTYAGNETASAQAAQSALTAGSPGAAIVVGSHGVGIAVGTGLTPPPLPRIAIGGILRSATLTIVAPNGARSVFQARPSALGVLLFGAPLDDVASALHAARNDLVLQNRRTITGRVNTSSGDVLLVGTGGPVLVASYRGGDPLPVFSPLDGTTVTVTFTSLGARGIDVQAIVAGAVPLVPENVVSVSDGTTTITITQPATGANTPCRPGTTCTSHSSTVILGPGGVPMGSVETSSSSSTTTTGILGIIIRRQ